MALTKKLANKITTLINDVTVANIMQASAVEKGEHDRIHYWRVNHDDAAKQLNEILGQEAVVCYYRDLQG